MSEMQPWTANERSKLPAYDRAFNAMLAPLLERQTQLLLNTKAFRDGDLTKRRAMLKKVMSDAKKQIRERMDKGYTTGENVKLRMVAKANSVGNKEIRRETAKAMKEKFGIDGSLDDYTFAELDLFMEYAEYLKQAYEEAAQF
jgi:hypothetical protein